MGTPVQLGAVGGLDIFRSKATLEDVNSPKDIWGYSSEGLGAGFGAQLVLGGDDSFIARALYGGQSLEELPEYYDEGRVIPTVVSERGGTLDLLYAHTWDIIKSSEDDRIRAQIGPRLNFSRWSYLSGGDGDESFPLFPFTSCDATCAEGQQLSLRLGGTVGVHYLHFFGENKNIYVDGGVEYSATFYANRLLAGPTFEASESLGADITGYRGAASLALGVGFEFK